MAASGQGRGEASSGVDADLALGLAAAEQGLEAEAASICSNGSRSAGSSSAEGRDNVLMAKMIEEALERSSQSGASEGSSGKRLHRQSRAGPSASEVTDGPASKSAIVSGQGTAVGTSSMTGQSVSSARSADGSGSVLHTNSSRSRSTSDVRSGSGSGVRPYTDTAELRAAAELYQTALAESGREMPLDEVMDQMARQPQKELQDLRDKLAAVNAREVQNSADNTEQMEVLEHLELAAHNQQEELEAAKEAEVLADDNRGDLEDQIKGMEAAQRMKLEMLEEELSANKSKNRLNQEWRDEKAGELKASNVEHNAQVKDDMMNSIWKLANAKTDRDALRRIAGSQQRANVKELEQLRTLIQMTRKGNQDRQNLTASSLTANEHMLEVLQQSEAQNQALQADMSELRLQMMGIERQNDVDLLALQKRVDSAKTSLDGEDAPIARGRSRKGAKPMLKGRAAPAGKMPSIDEEDDDTMSTSSCGHSGQVSSDGEGVGDLADFDDEEDFDCHGTKEEAFQVRMRGILDELQQERRAHALFRDEVAGTHARQASKAERMQRQIWDLKADRLVKTENFEEQNAELEQELSRHRDNLKLQGDKLDDLEVELRNQESAKDVQELAKSRRDVLQQEDMEEISNQLNHAIEMKRVSEMRMEDTKRELQRRHELDVAGYEATISELWETLRFGEGQEADGELGEEGQSGRPAFKSDTEVQNEQMIRLLQEERSEILHMLERKEAHWKSKMDAMDKQYSQDVAKLKKEQAQKVQALRQEKQELLAKKASIASEAKKLAKARSQEAASEQDEDVPELPPWLSFLGCPQRAVPQGPAVPTNCQATCWQALTTLPEVNAFFCNYKDLEITKASRKAYKVWGSAAVQGKSFLSLLQRRDEATWMKRAVGSHQVLADAETAVVQGFLVRELGCLALHSRSNNQFDALVTTVHVPAEPKKGLNKAIVVILQPIVEEGGGQRGLALGQGLAHPGSHPSKRGGRTARSVASDDISPSDSVSRVASESRRPP